MALSFDLTGIENYEQVCYVDGELNVVTKAIIFSSMWTKFYKITEANWKDIFMRIHMWELCFGGIMLDENGKQMLTATQIKQHIGLDTNGGSDTHPEFRKHLVSELERQARLDLKNELGDDFDEDDD